MGLVMPKGKHRCKRSIPPKRNRIPQLHNFHLGLHVDIFPLCEDGLFAPLPKLTCSFPSLCIGLKLRQKGFGRKNPLVWPLLYSKDSSPVW